MPEWTGEIVKIMHLNGITAKRLAEKAGYSEKYFSAVLNGRRTPRRAEEKVRGALQELIAEKEAC